MSDKVRTRFSRSDSSLRVPSTQYSYGSSLFQTRVGPVRFPWHFALHGGPNLDVYPSCWYLSGICAFASLQYLLTSGFDVSHYSGHSHHGYAAIEQWTPLDVRGFRSSWPVSPRTAARNKSMVKAFVETRKTCPEWRNSEIEPRQTASPFCRLWARMIASFNSFGFASYFSNSAMLSCRR